MVIYTVSIIRLYRHRSDAERLLSLNRYVFTGAVVRTVKDNKSSNLGDIHPSKVLG
jgi:hypothetical protein